MSHYCSRYLNLPLTVSLHPPAAPQPPACIQRLVLWYCTGYSQSHLELRVRAKQLISLSPAPEPRLRNVGGLDLSCLGELLCHDQNTLRNADSWLNYCGIHSEWATATPVPNGAAFRPSRLSGGCIYSPVPPVYWPGGMNRGQPRLTGHAVTCSSSTTTKNFWCACPWWNARAWTWLYSGSASI